MAKIKVHVLVVVEGNVTLATAVLLAQEAIEQANTRGNTLRLLEVNAEYAR